MTVCRDAFGLNPMTDEDYDGQDYHIVFLDMDI